MTRYVRAIQLENSNERAYNVHDPALCAGQVCVLHNRTKHKMRGWPQHWRSDRRIMERLCPHGAGHPDPDQWDRMVEVIGEDEARAEFVHGCDGCCR